MCFFKKQFKYFELLNYLFALDNRQPKWRCDLKASLTENVTCPVMSYLKHEALLQEIYCVGREILFSFCCPFGSSIVVLLVYGFITFFFSRIEHILPHFL